MQQLSVLIPVYCDNCLEQVKKLRLQCLALEKNGLLWEIVVADDGTPEGFDNGLDNVALLSGCRILRRGLNYGRSSTRNYLAHEARYPWLLYQDSGVMPSDRLIAKYLKYMGRADVVCGTVAVAPEAADEHSLRFRYEEHFNRNMTSEVRNRQPYQSFRTTNFLVRREVMLANPLSEEFSGYGYEDVLFGKRLKENKIPLLHIDNPVCYTRLESNYEYLSKISSALDTLAAHANELEGYSGILGVVLKFRHRHISWLLDLAYCILDRRLVSNLRGSNPKILWFNVWRLCRLNSVLKVKFPQKHR